MNNIPTPLEEHLQKYLYFYLILTMICWGISWPTSKILTQYSDIFTLMFLKFFFSVLTLIPLIFLIFKPKIYFNIKILKPLIFSTFFLLLYNLIFFYGLKVGYAGLGGVIVTGSNPIFTFLLVALIEKISIPKRQKFALILGIIGTIITVDIFSLELKNIFDGGNILFLLASLSWSLVTISNTKAKEFLNPILFIAYLYITSSLLSLLFFTSTEALVAILHYDWIFWTTLIFTTVITTGVATTFYFYASNIIGASKTSSYIFLVPLVAVISSTILLQEIPKISTLVGGAILIYAIYLINKK